MCLQLLMFLKSNFLLDNFSLNLNGCCITEISIMLPYFNALMHHEVYILCCKMFKLFLIAEYFHNLTFLKYIHAAGKIIIYLHLTVDVPQNVTCWMHFCNLYFTDPVICKIMLYALVHRYQSLKMKVNNFHM